MLVQFASYAQTLRTPAERSGFTQISSYEEMVKFIRQLDEYSGLMSVESFGKSVSGRDLFVMKFSRSGIPANQPKIKILIHAQQHGNEQSGKEGALLLAKELVKPQYAYLFDRIDLMLVPQVNPDGSEKNERKNSNGVDLNRNHLIMTEPEVIALHQLFDKYLFEVTLDVHEYSPYNEDWISRGYRKNTAILIGLNTNPQIPDKIREFQKKQYMPFWSEYLSSRGISNGMYSPGGPPEETYIRYSTFDINDGRQSYGIQNTFSFIQEGMNGEDNFVQNLSHRARSQSQGLLALLEFVYKNQKQMMEIVEIERENLISGIGNEEVALQMEHIPDSSKLTLPVYSYLTNSDSVIVVKNFRPVVKPTLSIIKPSGYLIPTSQTDLINWVHRQGFEINPLTNPENYIFEQLLISTIDSIDFEGDMIPCPQVATTRISDNISLENFVFIPATQLKGNLLVIALEPQSELGLATYSQFGFLMKEQSAYPVIRVKKLIVNQ
ncbi:MAG: M14 family zinc carboxypeptidase [Syntrophaceae bacterium]